MTTDEVIERHLQSFARRDLDGILADYDRDAVLFTADGVLRGREAIRALFVAMLAEFGKPGARFEMRTRAVEGDCGYIVWSAETADRRYELGTDTFVVRGGRIAVQSFAASAVSKQVGTPGIASGAGGTTAVTSPDVVATPSDG